jgi:hypothetical protein
VVLRNIRDGNSRIFIWRFNYERRRKIVVAVADVQVGEWLSSSMELKDPGISASSELARITCNSRAIGGK